MSNSPWLLSANQIPAGIFRAYDIRGEVDTALTAEVVHDIAVALGSEIRANGFNEVVTGRDGRLSSPILQKALIVQYNFINIRTSFSIAL